jgi:hypothetical protein
MTKRRIAWTIAILLAAIGIAGAVWKAVTGGRITFTAAQLQERVNRALPREFKGVTVDAATIAIAESRVALRVDVHAAAAGQSFSATASARGVPVYDHEHGAIHFEADNVEVSNVKAGGSLGSRLEGRFGGRLEEAASKLVATGIKTYLAARPVYRFKDDVKGIVLKAAVSNIAIEGDLLVITVSLVNLTTGVAAYVVITLLAIFIVIYLLTHPGWGLATSGAADAVTVSPISIIIAVLAVIIVIYLLL